MKTNLLKRILSLALSLTLLVGNIPAVVFAAEDPAAEEIIVPVDMATEPVAETVEPGETAAPTEVPAEPEETGATTEAPTEPPVEETTTPTEPMPEETAVPTEAATEPMVEETVPPTEAEKSLVLMDWQTVETSVDLPNPDELFAGYVEQVLYGQQMSVFGVAAGKRLTGDEKVLYDALVPVVKQIANGERASTCIGIGKTVNYNGNTYVADVPATFTTREISRESMGRVIDALLTDFPSLQSALLLV